MVLNVFDFSNVYWDRKITQNFSDQIYSKICWKLKNVQTTTTQVATMRIEPNSLPCSHTVGVEAC